jgi:UDPglucose 6-dehydrogenase
MYMDNISVSVIGLGFVGSAMVNSFRLKGYLDDINLFIYDKFRDGGIGRFNGTLNADIIFLALPTMYDENRGVYDITAIEEISAMLVEHEYKGVVVIKSTILPETTDILCDKYGLNFVHNPEFLTARTANEDFHNQTHIVLGQSKSCPDKMYNKVVQFYSTLYPSAQISRCRSTESESMKLLVNCFYAVKVQVNTEFYLLCQKMGISYDTVMSMMLKNGWINPMHTKVPGPDGKISYGGLCLPKDAIAATQLMRQKGTPHAVVSAAICERDTMRDDSSNIIKKN